MHSLKNTIIAVGLLGLSFVLYQASSTNHEEQVELIPALDISEGSDADTAMAPDTAATTEPDVNSRPEVSFPELPKSDFAKTAPFPSGNKKTPPPFEPPSTQPSAPKISSTPFPGAAPNSADAGAAKSDNSSFPSLPNNMAAVEPKTSIESGSFPTDAPGSDSVERQPLDNEARDQGLINALENQNWPPANALASSQPTPPTSSADGGAFPIAPPTFQPTEPNVTESGTELKNEFRPGVSNSDPDFGSLTYQAAWPQVDKFVAAKDYQSALRLLSRYYRSTTLTGPQRQRLIGWLDALAGKVIFSAEHHLQEMPYTVANESIEEIGQRWKVPPELIFNINRSKIPVATAITPGTQLKAVKGPFNAEIDRENKVMTLFLGELYAGRYPIQVGISGEPQPGKYHVMVKSAEGHSWRDAEGNEFAPGTPQNGYGPNWIGLSGSLCIHEVAESTGDGHHGCIGLNPQDAKDVFGILAEGSNVKIIR